MYAHNSKAVGGEPANGFAYVPHTCAHTLGLSDRQRQERSTSERTVFDQEKYILAARLFYGHEM
jgi:hypothetical protein